MGGLRTAYDQLSIEQPSLNNSFPSSPVFHSYNYQQFSDTAWVASSGSPRSLPNLQPLGLFSHSDSASPCLRLGADTQDMLRRAQQHQQLELPLPCWRSSSVWLGKAARRLIPNAGHSLLNVCMASRRVQTPSLGTRESLQPGCCLLIHFTS